MTQYVTINKQQFKGPNNNELLVHNPTRRPHNPSPTISSTSTNNTTSNTTNININLYSPSFDLSKKENITPQLRLWRSYSIAETSDTMGKGPFNDQNEDLLANQEDGECHSHDNLDGIAKKAIRKQKNQHNRGFKRPQPQTPYNSNQFLMKTTNVVNRKIQEDEELQPENQEKETYGSVLEFFTREMFSEWHAIDEGKTSPQLHVPEPGELNQLIGYLWQKLAKKQEELEQLRN